MHQSLAAVVGCGKIRDEATAREHSLREAREGKKEREGKMKTKRKMESEKRKNSVNMDI